MLGLDAEIVLTVVCKTSFLSQCHSPESKHTELLLR
jgi:hypothetical protein